MLFKKPEERRHAVCHERVLENQEFVIRQIKHKFTSTFDKALHVQGGESR